MSPADVNHLAGAIIEAARRQTEAIDLLTAAIVQLADRLERALQPRPEDPEQRGEL